VRTHAASSALSGLALLIVLMAAWATRYHALPLQDDFTLAAQGQTLNFFEAAFEKAYWNWMGRWAEVGILVELLSAIDLVRFYWAPLFVLGFIQVGALYLALRALFERTLARMPSLLLALAFSALLWSCRPAPHETVHWLTGALPYDLGLSCALLTIAGACRLGACRAGRRPYAFAALAAAGVLTSGLHEYFGAVLCIWLAVGTTLGFRLRLPSRSAWAGLLAITIAGFLFVMTAPGTGVRTELSMPLRGSIAHALGLVRYDLRHVLPAWVYQPTLLSASLLFVLLPWIRRSRPSWLQDLQVPWFRLFLSTGIVVMVTGMAAFHWSTGWKMNGRAEDSQFSVFFVSWFAALFVGAHRLWQRFDPGGAGDPWRIGLLRLAAAAALAVSLLATGNFAVALEEFRSGRLARWRRTQLEQFRLCDQARLSGQRSVVIPREVRCPLYVRENLPEVGTARGGNPRTRYFGLQRITLEPRRRTSD
jgi:hypothetical protein